MSRGIDPEKVIQRLGGQIGGLTAELAMRDEAIEQLQGENDELRAKLAELYDEVKEPSA
jgi:predicted nuclease with TOPRIM domain